MCNFNLAESGNTSALLWLSKSGSSKHLSYQYFYAWQRLWMCCLQMRKHWRPSMHNLLILSADAIASPMLTSSFSRSSGFHPQPPPYTLWVCSSFGPRQLTRSYYAALTYPLAFHLTNHGVANQDIEERDRSNSSRNNWFHSASLWHQTITCDHGQVVMLWPFLAMWWWCWSEVCQFWHSLFFCIGGF